MATQISIKCAPIKKTLDGLKAALTALQNELNGGLGGSTRPKPAIIKDIGIKSKEIGVAQAKLDECIRVNPLPPPPPPIDAPKHILETNFKNPKFDTSDPDWAAKFAGGGTGLLGTFPLGSDREWKQVLSPGEDYDFDKVGASGWVVQNPKLASKDFPFLHPFGFDWKFELALYLLP